MNAHTFAYYKNRLDYQNNFDNFLSHISKSIAHGMCKKPQATSLQQKHQDNRQKKNMDHLYNHTSFMHSKAAFIWAKLQ